MWQGRRQRDLQILIKKKLIMTGERVLLWAEGSSDISGVQSMRTVYFILYNACYLIYIYIYIFKQIIINNKLWNNKYFKQSAICFCHMTWLLLYPAIYSNFYYFAFLFQFYVKNVLHFLQSDWEGVNERLFIKLIVYNNPLHIGVFCTCCTILYGSLFPPLNNTKKVIETY